MPRSPRPRPASFLDGMALWVCMLVGSASAATTHYVNVASANPVSPFTDWSTASTNIQDAVDVASSHDLILVTNGVYATGGRAVHGVIVNRVAIDRAITVASVSGPGATVIQGLPPDGFGNGAMRCVYVGTNASLVGFTLTNGFTLATGPLGDRNELWGGGAWCEDSGVLSNCVLVGNSAYRYGGGVYRGTLNDCTIMNNWANDGGGGASEATLNRCTIIGNSVGGAGGGAYGGTLNGCTIATNSADSGGGAYEAALNNCTLSGNTVFGYGGGSYGGTLNDCTFRGNSADSGGGCFGGTLSNCTFSGNTVSGYGGGAYGGELNQCIMSGNSASAYGGGTYGGTLNDCSLLDNSAAGGGGAYDGTLNRCTFASNSATDGGGGYAATLNNCTLFANTATSLGGGACQGTLNSCILSSNSADSGGGAALATLNNCTITGNSASSSGGGDYQGTLNNCIAYYNSAPADTNCCNDIIRYSCTTPGPEGPGNITAQPRFADAAGGDYRLQTNSPCIDCGDNDYVGGASDLEGNPRIVNGVVDMGAYEDTNGTWRLTILSEHGVAAPAAGQYLYRPGAVLTNRVTGLDTRVATQFVCSGWAMAGTTGTTTNCVLTLTNDTGLTWLWKTNYWLNLAATAHGSVAPTSGWFEVNTNIDVQAYPQIHCYFVGWTGAVNDIVNPFTTNVMTPFSVTACFGEYLATNGVPYAWLAQYGLPTNDAGALYEDGDGMSAWQEYIADTDPTNSLSFLHITSLGIVSGPGSVYVGWSGGRQAWQFLERATNLLDTGTVWSVLWSNPPPNATSTNFTDTAATNTIRFYRVRSHR